MPLGSRSAGDFHKSGNSAPPGVISGLVVEWVKRPKNSSNFVPGTKFQNHESSPMKNSQIRFKNLR